MPVPVPTPVAVKVTPTVFEAAPIETKSVVPTLRIVYSVPGTIAVALNNPGVLLKVTVLRLVMV